MKPLVIYHASCADGYGAAFAAWRTLGDEAEYLPMQYGQKGWDHTTCYGREVYIVDFSFPREIMDDLFTMAKRVVWLDHHKTAFEMWCPPELEYHEDQTGDFGDHYVLLDNSRSGALIAWEYFHPDLEVPMLIRHIDDYDRWQFKLDGTKEIIKALWSYAPWTFEQWDNWLNRYYETRDMFVEGLAILRAHDQNVQSVVKGAARECRVVIKTEEFGATGEPGLAINCPPHLTSDVGHELATQSGTFGLMWCVDKNNKCKCSLRSNGDYDVSIIAKFFGGGGHKNAAGFEVDIQTLLGWIK